MSRVEIPSPAQIANNPLLYEALRQGKNLTNLSVGETLYVSGGTVRDKEQEVHGPRGSRPEPDSSSMSHILEADAIATEAHERMMADLLDQTENKGW